MREAQQLGAAQHFVGIIREGFHKIELHAGDGDLLSILAVELARVQVQAALTESNPPPLVR